MKFGTIMGKVFYLVSSPHDLLLTGWGYFFGLEPRIRSQISNLKGLEVFIPSLLEVLNLNRFDLPHIIGQIVKLLTRPWNCP
jgi:hypothetical protein